MTAANCAAPVLTGVTVDGAHAECMVADISGTVHLPEQISYELAAPTMCAGYTVWAGLRRADARPGARVAVSGIGGLGHLAIQYAKAAGYHVTAVTRTPGKRDLALATGCGRGGHGRRGPKSAGGADLLMHTNSSHAAVADAMEGLRPWGKVVVNGVGFDDMALPMLSLVSNSYQVIGSAHNGLEYLAKALGFVARGEVTPMVEVFPKETSTRLSLRQPPATCASRPS